MLSSILSVIAKPTHPSGAGVEGSLAKDVRDRRRIRHSGGRELGQLGQLGEQWTGIYCASEADKGILKNAVLVIHFAPNPRPWHSSSQ
jgi:hypothetical protein